MHAHEDSGHVYKLVFHPNAHLCAGWQPDHHVLWSPMPAPSWLRVARPDPRHALRTRCARATPRKRATAAGSSR